MRLVLDTNVIVSAFRSRRGASNRILRLADEGQLDVLISTALFLEYEAVLKRKEIRAVTGHSLNDVNDVMAALASIALPVDILFRTRPQLRDPDDEMVFEVAVNGMANAIVTHNVRDFSFSSKQAFQILTPSEALEKLTS